MRRWLLLPLLAVATGCGTGSAPSDSDSIVVFAASSLTDAFTELGEAFSVQHPDIRVMFNFAGSNELVAQLLQGAPADVFVSADESSMEKLVEAGESSGEPVVIARNTFQIIVEPGNPQGIADVADLADPDLVVVLCAESVPCGIGAASILDDADVAVTAKSLEDRVKGVVTKVTTGEADAGIVYVTDVIAAGTAADGVAIPTDLNATSRYPIVVTRAAADPAIARTFIDFVAGSEGRAILASYGFLAP